MKLPSLVPNFNIHVSGSILYIPTIGHIWNLCFPVSLERTLSSATGAKGRAGNCRQAEVGGSSLPSPPLLQLSREFTDQHTNFQFGKLQDHKWNQLILVVNFLFGSRVNEIANKPFILDSHRLFLCSAQRISVSFPPLLKVCLVSKRGHLLFHFFILQRSCATPNCTN